MAKTKSAEVEGKGWFNNSIGGGFFPCRETLGPISLMVLTPLFSIFIVYVIREKGGSITAAFSGDRPGAAFLEWWPNPLDPEAIAILATFMGMALFLTRILPHEMFYGAVTPAGARPPYQANGPLFYVVATALFFAGSDYGLGLYNGGVLYDKYPEIIASLNVFAFLLCGILYVKGLVAPSTPDSGRASNFFFDFYYGTELHPNVLGFDVKQFTNCRFGMMWWALANVSFALKAIEMSKGGLPLAAMISAAAQWVYLLKFFLWETGYFNTMDIQVDRAGFYICWGCLVWVPAVYTSPCHFFAARYDVAKNLSPATAAFILFCACLMIWMNYDCDKQKQDFRKSGGKNNVWGQPPKFIRATYQTEKGEKRTSLLLCSGWWGIARHFHYVPEILASFFWVPPVQVSFFIPWFYVIFLTILLFDRAFRDELRCQGKYGKFYEDYCKLVPFRVIPLLF